MTTFTRSRTYEPMQSIALRKKRLSRREKLFKLKCDYLSEQVANTRLDDSDLDSALWTTLRTFEDLRSDLADDPQIRDKVDSLMNSVGVTAYNILPGEIHTAEGQNKYLKVLEDLEVGARLDEDGSIYISAKSKELCRQHENHFVSASSQPSGLIPDEPSAAEKGSTWDDTIDPLRFKHLLGPTSIGTYTRNQKDEVPQIARRLTENLKEQLAEDQEALEARAKRTCVRRHISSAYSVDQDWEDQNYRLRCPNSKEFFSLVSRKDLIKFGKTCEAEMCSKLERSILDSLQQKAKTGTSEIGSLDGLYVELKINADELIEKSRKKLSRKRKPTKYQLGENSIQLHLLSSNGFHHSINAPKSENFSDSADIRQSCFDKPCCCAPEDH